MKCSSQAWRAHMEDVLLAEPERHVGVARIINARVDAARVHEHDRVWTRHRGHAAGRHPAREARAREAWSWEARGQEHRAGGTEPEAGTSPARRETHFQRLGCPATIHSRRHWCTHGRPRCCHADRHATHAREAKPTVQRRSVQRSVQRSVHSVIIP